VNRVGAKSLAAVSAQILAEVEAEERTKMAELAAVHESTPTVGSEIGELMRKVAGELRAAEEEVTYDDLERFVGGAA